MTPYCTARFVNVRFWPWSQRLLACDPVPAGAPRAVEVRAAVAVGITDSTGVQVAGRVGEDGLEAGLAVEPDLDVTVGGEDQVVDVVVVDGPGVEVEAVAETGETEGEPHVVEAHGHRSPPHDDPDSIPGAGARDLGGQCATQAEVVRRGRPEGHDEGEVAASARLDPQSQLAEADGAGDISPGQPPPHESPWSAPEPVQADHRRDRAVVTHPKGEPHPLADPGGDIDGQRLDGGVDAHAEPGPPGARRTARSTRTAAPSAPVLTAGTVVGGTVAAGAVGGGTVVGGTVVAGTVVGGAVVAGTVTAGGSAPPPPGRRRRRRAWW